MLAGRSIHAQRRGVIDDHPRAAYRARGPIEARAQGAVTGDLAAAEAGEVPA
jgi:hypothetical protein